MEEKYIHSCDLEPSTMQAVGWILSIPIEVHISDENISTQVAFTIKIVSLLKYQLLIYS